MRVVQVQSINHMWEEGVFQLLSCQLVERQSRNLVVTELSW